MMAAGFLEEVIGLRRSQDLSARHPSMRAVGYRQLWAHLDGQYALEEGVQRALAGDAPTGKAAADLDAGRGPRGMDRSGQSAVVESRHMSCVARLGL